MKKETVIIRKAKISDAAAIQRLIQYYAREDIMLPRPLMEIYENIRDYVVAVRGKTLIGCCALHICWKNLAELKALAVRPKHRKKGTGTLLIKEALEEAVRINIKKIFCLTYIPGFFEKRGFGVIDKSELPHSVWAECVNCVKFPDCDETAMIISL